MPNILAAPRAWKKKAILIKAEAAVGTDAVPTGLLNWFEARNVNLTPFDAETAERNIEQPYFGNGGKLITGKYAKLSFEIALAGSGAAGTAPKVAPVLLACGFAETISAGASAAYNLVSEAIGAVTAYINIDGTLHKLVGSRGNLGATLSAKGIPMLKVDLESIYVAPVDEVLPAVDKTGWPIEEVVNAANTAKLTLGGVDLAYSALEWSLGNKLARIDLPGPQREVAITDRAPTSSATVLAPGLAVFDPFALAEASNVLTLTTTHGSAAGKKVQIDEKVRITGVEYDRIEDQMLAYKLTLEPTPVAGNDEIALTYL